MTNFLDTIKELEHRHQQPMPFSVRDALLALSARIDALAAPKACMKVSGVQADSPIIDEAKKPLKGKKSA